MVRVSVSVYVLVQTHTPARARCLVASYICKMRYLHDRNYRSIDTYTVESFLFIYLNWIPGTIPSRFSHDYTRYEQHTILSFLLL